MTNKEFSAFTMALRTYYPRENLLPNDQAMVLWYESLKDLPGDLVTAVLQKWVMTNKWSPSIAELREQALLTTQGEQKTWAEAWESVIMAIRRHGYCDQAGAMESLDSLTRECVRCLGYQNLCRSENPAADRANFRMVYENRAGKKRQQEQLPGALRATLKVFCLPNEEECLLLE